MRRWFRFLLGTLTVMAVIGLSALLTLWAVARSRGVIRVSIPGASIIETKSQSADYSDAYRMTIRSDLFRDSGSLDRFAFQKGARIGATLQEIVYTGNSPGLRYYISYLVRHVGSESNITVSTIVHYHTWKGQLYFTNIKPVHRVLTPFMVSIMVRNAEDADA